MSLTDFLGYPIPTEWLYIGIPLFLILLIGIPVLVLKLFGQKDAPESQRMRMAAVIPVNQNNNIGTGRLLGNVQRTEKDLLVTDPDMVDESTGEPKVMTVPIEGILPVDLRDDDGNIIEFWAPIWDRGEWTAASFTDLLANVRQRFDPLEADPRDVGRHYVGWQGMFQKGLAQVLQSTTGKLLVFGAVFLIGLLLGVFFEGAHTGHF